jgi:MFS family permease
MSSLGHGTNDMYWFILPILLPLMLDQFKMDYTAAGVLLTAFLFVIALLSFFMGWASDRVSPPIVIGLGFLLASSSLMAAGFIQSFPLFVFFLLLAAAGVSTFHPAIYNLINEAVKIRKGWAFGRFEFWGLTAIFLLVVVAGTLLRVMHWKGVIAIIALPGFVIGVLFLRFRRELLRDHPEKGSVSQRSAARPDSPTGVVPFILLCASSMLLFLSITAVMNFMPTFFVKEIGLSPALASYTSGFYFFGGMITALLAGLWIDRHSPVWAYLILCALMVPLVLIFSLPLPGWMLPSLLVLLGACAGAFMPSRNMLFAVFGKQMGSGRVFGIVMAISTIVHSISPALFGVIADQWGLRAAIRVFTLPVILGCISAVAFAQSIKNQRDAFVSS